MFVIVFGLFLIRYHCIGIRYIRKRVGLKGSPCFTPIFMLTGCVEIFWFVNLVYEFDIKFMMKFLIVGLIFICVKIELIAQCCTESNAALKSMYVECRGILSNLDDFINSKYVIIAEEVSLFLLKPHCSFGRILCVKSLILSNKDISSKIIYKIVKNKKISIKLIILPQIMTLPKLS